MKEIISIYYSDKLNVFIRNRWTRCFSNEWHLVNLQLAFHGDRTEYKVCLIGFELVFMTS